MKLSTAAEISVEESRILFEDVAILENGEGPRWRFDYSNFKHDKTPDILLLGAYRHPKTGNNLVGGINLHYLNDQQIDKLSQLLPKIMSVGNLYGRYHAGIRLLPDIFKNYYRTYNAAYVHGVQQGVMYPKYGYMKTAANWIKKKVSGIFKSKAQRQREAEPQYPDDLDNMHDKLDKTMLQLQRRKPVEMPDTPEIQAARNAFLKYRREQSMQDIERREDIPLQQAAQDYDKHQRQLTRQPEQLTRKPEQLTRKPEQLTRKPEQPMRQPEQYEPEQYEPEQYEPEQYEPEQYEPEQYEPEQYDPEQYEPEQYEPEQLERPDLEEPLERFERERDENIEELSDPNNDIDLEESIIRYYSPSRRRYITESIKSILTGDEYGY